ncbi:hypothetical protein GRF29_216g1195944 [Pseudopithomyces chartarum]|uniref:Uncharacterized protein n=1 Tax=Pseudopithomyces chartarum TaxID=1892770 RepID=A0AAN6LME9_9PLEO|nr:hypothetical protein GRF29_216g1195944 [Pseudopithomyces chartarum]
MINVRMNEFDAYATAGDLPMFGGYCQICMLQSLPTACLLPSPVSPTISPYPTPPTVNPPTANARPCNDPTLHMKPHTTLSTSSHPLTPFALPLYTHILTTDYDIAHFVFLLGTLAGRLSD